MPPKPSIQKVACLPVAGIGNPYQHLMMQGLNASGRLVAFNGAPSRFFGILQTAVLHKSEYLHFDWINSYYWRKASWMTLLSVPVFMAQVLIVRHLFGIKIVWTLHNIVPHDVEMLGVHRFCQRFLAKRCAWIRIFSADSLSRAVSELGVPADRFRIVPEGSYVGFYEDSTTQLIAKQTLKVPSDKRLLLYAGLVKPYKGVLELIQLFKRLDFPNTVLLIAGKAMDANYQTQIEAELTDNVRFDNNFVAANKLQFYFGAADLVVLPFNKIENSGSVILAMGFRKAIVAPNLAVVKQRLTQQTELLFDKKNTLENRIQFALNLPVNELIEIGNRNFEALNKYQWQDFAACFE